MNSSILREITTIKQEIARKIRLAAYCRVSSDSADQLHSFAAQIRYYSEYTKKHTEYELVDIYADATVIIGLKQNPTNGRRFSPIFFVYWAFFDTIR